MPPRYVPVEAWERRLGAAKAPLGGYRRREPEETLLHQVVRARLEPFLTSARSCSNCNARRMEDAAEHLVHDVFPRVPVSQWVLSFPRRIRFRAARDPAFCSGLLDLFPRAVFALPTSTPRPPLRLRPV